MAYENFRKLFKTNFRFCIMKIDNIPDAINQEFKTRPDCLKSKQLSEGVPKCAICRRQNKTLAECINSSYSYFSGGVFRIKLQSSAGFKIYFNVEAYKATLLRISTYLGTVI